MQNVTDNNQAIAGRINQAMVARGMEQKDLVDGSGVDKSTVSRILSGARGEGLRRETRRKLAAALGVSELWLFGGVGVDPFGDSSGGPAAAVDVGRERYPSKRAAAAGLRGIVDEEAIAAMLSEEHYGMDGDPGADFWFERGLWWNERRKKAKSGQHAIVLPRTDLDEPPPMTGRPKTKRR